MKNSIRAILFLLLSFLLENQCFADVLTSEQMGYMSLSDYGYYVGMLGVICGFAFVMGIRQ